MKVLLAESPKSGRGGAGINEDSCWSVNAMDRYVG